MSNEMMGENANANQTAQRRIIESLYSRQDEKLMDESVIHYVSLKNEKLANSLRNQLNVSCLLTLIIRT